MARRTVTVDAEIDRETKIRRPNLRGLPLSSHVETDDGDTMTISVEGTLREIQELEQRTKDDWQSGDDQEFFPGREADRSSDEPGRTESARSASGATITREEGVAPNSGIQASEVTDAGLHHDNQTDPPAQADPNAPARTGIQESPTGGVTTQETLPRTDTPNSGRNPSGGRNR